MHKPHQSQAHKGYLTAGLFSGIGGIELGFSRAGHTAHLLCEIDSDAQAILSKRFPGVTIVSDVRALRSVGDAQLICAGFPCQDLSQAGKTAGINGSQSGLINELFRLLDCSTTPDWVLLENVPFMLHLARGAAMRFLVSQFESRGYTWAYRVVDSRAFGLPQRRQRVLFLASKSKDPRAPLLNQDRGKRADRKKSNVFGFYWTEGNTGLGWAVNAIPTLKGGSSFGIPSPPAIWVRDRGIYIPDIRDAERLQGFKPGWTNSEAATNRRTRLRWKLLGNAMNVSVAEWIGRRLSVEEAYVKSDEAQLTGEHCWPAAAWGNRGRKFAVDRSAWPIDSPPVGLLRFLNYPLVSLSANATEGFLKRARASRLNFEAGFLEGLSDHLDTMRMQNGKPRSKK